MKGGDSSPDRGGKPGSADEELAMRLILEIVVM